MLSISPKIGIEPNLQSQDSVLGTRLLAMFFLFCMFDWTIWAHIPVSPSLISLIRQSIDGIFYSIVTILFLSNRPAVDLLAKKMIVVMAIIGLSVTCSTIYYQSELFLAFQTLFVVFRYSIVLLIPCSKSGKYLINIIIYTFYIQLTIGLVEGLNLFDMRSLLLPSIDRWEGVSNFNPTSFRENIDVISSTFLNTIDYSLYLMGTYVLLYWKKVKRLKWVVSLIVLFCVWWTGSKTSLFVTSILMIVELRSEILRWVTLTVATILIGLSINNNWEIIIFFWENSLEYSRIGFFVYLLPPFFSGNAIPLLIGVGVDLDAALYTIRNYPVIPKMLLDENSMRNIKDVFWIAQLFQWGAIATVALITYIVNTYKNTRSNALRGIIFITILLGFTNQVLESKMFSFIFWLTMKFHAEFDDL